MDFLDLISNSEVSSESKVYGTITVAGKSGAGKSTLIATAPNVIILAAEKKKLSLTDPNIKDKINPKALIVPVKSVSDITLAYEFLVIHCELRDRLESAIKKGEPKEKIESLLDKLWKISSKEPRKGRKPELYYNVSIDSLTELHRIFVDEITNQSGLSDEYISVDLENLTAKVSLDVGKTDYGHYKKNTDMIRKVLRYFSDLKMNKIYSVLTETKKNDVTGENEILPVLSPALIPNIEEISDIVGYYDKVMKKIMEKKPSENEKEVIKEFTKEFRIFFEPFVNMNVKDCSGKLGSGMRNPSMGEIIKKANLGSLDFEY